MARGDLLFWPASAAFTDKAIAAFTDGPYVHCSVDLGDGTDIGAHSKDGVQIRPSAPHTLLTVYPISNAYARQGFTVSAYRRTFVVEAGILWLRKQIGRPYGYCTIFNAIALRLDLPYRLTRLGYYDCSALVAHYLQHIGLDLSDEPDSLSPNDLARSLGLLKAEGVA